MISRTGFNFSPRERSYLEKVGARICFPEKVIKQAQSTQIPTAELERRPEVKGITIDSPDPHEMDDAFSIQEVPGGYIARVSIADPAALVPINSRIDKEACERGASLYLENGYVPMLPQEIIEQTTLTEGKPRLALTVTMAFNHEGQRLSTDVAETVFTNQKVMDCYEADEAMKSKSGDPQLVENLINGAKLAKTLYKLRRKQGAITLFDIDDGLVVAENGFVARADDFEQCASYQIVRELMVATNTAIAKYMRNRGPVLFRCHLAAEDAPDRERMVRIFHQYRVSAEEGRIRAKVGSWFGEAYYSPENDGHVGLGLAAYVHFTSPIRRYPDLMLHRILKLIINDYGFNEESIEQANELLKPIADHASVQPRRSEVALKNVLKNEEKRPKYLAMEPKQFSEEIRKAVEFNSYRLPRILAAAEQRTLRAIDLLRLIQGAATNRTAWEFLTFYFQSERPEVDYLESLKKICRENGWLGPQTSKGIRCKIRLDGEWKTTREVPKKARRGLKTHQRAAYLLLRAYLLNQLINVSEISTSE